MVRRGGLGYRTQAQKDGRSAGQRKRRMASDRKRRNRESNVYTITVRDSIVSDFRTDKQVGVFGIYKKNDEWHLTALAVQRSKERLVSDRQGAVRSEVIDRLLVIPQYNSNLRPYDGLHLGTFDKKKDAMKEINADSSTRIKSGQYVVKPEDWNRSMYSYTVDRDTYSDFRRKQNVISISGPN